MGDEYTCAGGYTAISHPLPPAGALHPGRCREGKRCVPTDAFSKGIPPQLGKLQPAGPESSKAKT